MLPAFKNEECSLEMYFFSLPILYEGLSVFFILNEKIQFSSRPVPKCFWCIQFYQTCYLISSYVMLLVTDKQRCFT